MNPNKIAIIGGGFTGMMLVTQLIEKYRGNFEIILIDKNSMLGRGIAYNAYSDEHLLNVITQKMSAFPDRPDHFLNWVMSQDQFKDKDRSVIAHSFLQRKLYGQYLSDIWQQTLLKAESEQIRISIIDGWVTELDKSRNFISLTIDDGSRIKIDYCVIATGNQIPGNLNIKNPDFYKSENYFQNPWEEKSVQVSDKISPVLVIGNGLTMVDTVFGLLEQGFKGEIYSVSPNGYNILSHKHLGIPYTKLSDELTPGLNLYELVKLVNKHIKIVREYGFSAEPVIDSLRPYTQKIWKSLSQREKEIFMSRLRHLWGVARHRIPLHSHDRIQQLRIDGRLHIYAGKLINFTESEGTITVEYFDKKTKKNKILKVSRVINCTGPQSDLMELPDSFLKKCLLKGILFQDKLKLGIKTDTETFQVMTPNHNLSKNNLFVIGLNLKGELWESTAVSELRTQAEKLAQRLIANGNQNKPILS